jgi:hypothetical protein
MGIFHGWEPDRRFMIWTVYVDEADSHAPAPIMGLGGFISTADKWKALDDAWNNLLLVSGVRYFHAVDLIHKKKQFKGWTNGRHNSFIFAAQELINKYIDTGFVSLLRRDDYNNHYKSLAKPRKMPEDTMYGVLFRGGVSFSLEILTRAEGAEAGQDIVNFIIESGPANGYAQQLYHKFKNDPMADPVFRQMLGPVIGFAAKKESPGCQVVDLMLGGEIRQERLEHGIKPSLIENSSWAGVTRPIEQTDIPTYRIPVTKGILESLRKDMFVEEDMRREFARELLAKSRS